MLIFAKESHALACKTTLGYVASTVDVGTTVAIPPTLPVGSVIWRSPQNSVDLQCWKDYPGAAEWVYLYINIDDPKQTQLGGQVEVGLTYNGQDYLCSSPVMQSGKFCRMRLDVLVRECYYDSGCPGYASTFHVDFGFFIAKKADGKPGQEGSVTGKLHTIRAVQFNGEGGANVSNSNYTVSLKGVDKLRYVGCSSTVDISPRVIDFGVFGSASVKKGATIRERPFSITATKECSSAYGLGGGFFPVSGNLSDANKTLVPANNKSVGIQLLSAEDQKQIEFKKEFPIAPIGSIDRFVQKKMLARLLWNADEAVLGDFNAAAKLEIYYK